MKHLLRALFLAVAVTLCTAIFALPSAAEDFSGGFDPERFLVYEGLQARSKNDYAGLRSRYTVDDELITELVKEGHTVQYGAMMGIGSYQTTDYRQLSDLAVTYDKTTNKISFNVKNAAIAIVYDSTGVNNPSGLYTARGEIKSSFAYTTTYKQNDMNATMLKDIAMVYRAFIIIDGNVEYVDAVGQTFGKDDATYGRTTSLYEVCDYFATKYETASGKPFENSVAIRNVISSCMSDSFKAEFEGGLTLTSSMSSAKATFENAKAGIYSVKYKYIPNTAQGAFYAIKSAESGHTASTKIPFDASGTVTTPSWSPVCSYIYLAEGKNTLSFAGSGSQPALYGVELTLLEAMPVEDTAAVMPNASNTTVTKVASNDATMDKKYGGERVFLRRTDYATTEISVNATALYDLYFVYNSGCNVTVSANGTDASSSGITVQKVLKWDGTNSSDNNSSHSTSANYMKVEGVLLNEGKNALKVTAGSGGDGFISYGTIIAVRKSETVTLYDQDGVTPISVQKVYDLADVVYPNNVKVPAGYDAVSGWSEITLVDGKYQSTVAYVKYYTVKFYDYDRTTLLSTMEIVAGSDNAGPDMSGDKTFKGWSTPLSEVNSDCSVYAVKKSTTASVSASDAILASASFTKVAADAVYSNFEGYYSITETETAFIAGEVYTKSGDTYTLALTDTGATYYALTVTAVKATSASTLTDYYTYTYTMDEESPIQVAGTNKDDIYTPATQSAGEVIFLPDSTKFIDETVTLKVWADYAGSYVIETTCPSSMSRAWYLYARNNTTVEQNPNIEAFMVSRYFMGRIQPISAKKAENKANFLIGNNGGNKDYVFSYIYLAEGWNYITLANTKNSKENSTGLAMYGVTFTLAYEHTEDGATFAGGVSKFNYNIPTNQYDYLGSVTRKDNNASGTAPDLTLFTGLKADVKAGTYNIYAMTVQNATAIYTFKKPDGTAMEAIEYKPSNVSNTLSQYTTQANAEPFANVGGTSYGGYIDRFVGTVTFDVDGTYTLDVTGYASAAYGYFGFAGLRIEPVTEETHTVKFYDGDGNLVSIQAVADGAAAVAPTVEEKKFLGWSADFSAVTEDMSVYAIYDVRFDVEYYDNEGSIIFTESVQKGAVATPPDYKTYKEFKGWSLSPDEYIPADLSSVTSNTKVYLCLKKTELSATNFVPSKDGMVVAVGDGTLETIYLAANTKGNANPTDYVTFDVNADIEGYYALNLLLNDGGAKVDYVRVKNTTVETYEKNYYGVTRLNSSSTKASVTVDNCAVAEGTAYKNGIIHIYLHEGPNTLRLHAEAKAIGLADVTLSLVSGDALAGDYYAIYDKNSFVAAESNTTAQGSDTCVNESYSGGYMLRKERYVTLTERLTVNETGLYSLGAVISSVSVNAMTKGTVTLIDVNDSTNTVVFNANPTGNRCGTHSALFWHSNCDVQTVKEGTYKVRIDSIDSTYIFAAYYLTRADITTHAVSFVDSNGATISVQTVANGEAATAPDMSGDAGFIRWNRDFSNITGDTTVTAVRRHTVTFRTHDGVLIAKKETVTGDTVVAPEIPERIGYYIVGWSKDFSSVTEDMSVRAVYKELEPCTVNFYVNGEIVKTETVLTGGAATAPTVDLDGYIFYGWDKDFSRVMTDLDVTAYLAKESFHITASEMTPVGTNAAFLPATATEKATVYLPKVKNSSTIANSEVTVYSEFTVNAPSAGYYLVEGLVNAGGKKIDYTLVQNATEGLGLWNTYRGVSRILAKGTATDITAATAGVPNDSTNKQKLGTVYLAAGKNTLRFFVAGANDIGISDIYLTLKSTPTTADTYTIEAREYTATNTNFADMGTSRGLQFSNGSNYYAKYEYEGGYLHITEGGVFTLSGTCLFDGVSSIRFTFTEVNSGAEYVCQLTSSDLAHAVKLCETAVANGYYTIGELELPTGDYNLLIEQPSGISHYQTFILTYDRPMERILDMEIENGTLRANESTTVNIPVLHSGNYAVYLAADNASVAGNILSAKVNGKAYTNASLPAYADPTVVTTDAVLTLPLFKGDNSVTFTTSEKITLSALRLVYLGEIDTAIYGETVTVDGGAFTLTSDAAKYSEWKTYTVSVLSPATRHFVMDVTVNRATVIEYVLLSPSGEELYNTVYCFPYDITETTSVVIDHFDFREIGNYTLKIRIHKSPTSNSTEGAEIQGSVTLNVSAISFPSVAPLLDAPTAVGGSVTNAAISGDTAIDATNEKVTLTYTGVLVRENAHFSLGLIGRISGGTTVTVRIVGDGNTDPFDFTNRHGAFSVASGVTAGNVTSYYVYNPEKGLYEKATAYNAGTVYYEKTSEFNVSEDGFTYTQVGNAYTSEFMLFGSLNLLSDTYTVTITVEDGTLAYSSLFLSRDGDYVRVIEIETEDNDVRVSANSDLHYAYGDNQKGYTMCERAELLANALADEKNNSSLDAAFMLADYTMRRLNGVDTPAPSKVYYYAPTYATEYLMAPLRENDIPFFVTHSGHDYTGSEEWYKTYGYEKNYAVKIGDALYICIDYYYLQADVFAHETAAGIKDVDRVFYDEVMTLLDSDEIKYGVIMAHYKLHGSMPLANNILKHEKVEVSFGGHTHYSNDSTSTDADQSEFNGKDFVPTANFAHTAGYAGYGDTDNPYVAITVNGRYAVLSGVSVASKASFAVSEIGAEYFNKNYGENANLTGKWYTVAYTDSGEQIIRFRDVNAFAKGDYVKKDDGVYLVTSYDNVKVVTVKAALADGATVAEDAAFTGCVAGIDYFIAGYTDDGDCVAYLPEDERFAKGDCDLYTNRAFYVLRGDALYAITGSVVLTENEYANKQSSYEACGNPWAIRILEYRSGTNRDILEAYLVVPEINGSAYYQPYYSSQADANFGFAPHTYRVIASFEHTEE